VSEQESVSERELADYLNESVFSEGPRSVGEALAAGEETPPEPPPTPEVPEPPIEEPPAVVTDEPAQPVPTPPEEPAEVPEVPKEPEEPEAEVEEVETEDDPNVVWAKKKYGDDPVQWAKAAYNQERHISTLVAQKKEAEELATQWYEYAQQAEQQQSFQPSGMLPLSQAEENWIEQAMVNPLEYARQAAYSGNGQLYNAVIARVAEENAMFAAQIGSQVQAELTQAAQAQAEQQQPVEPEAQLPIALAGSFQRLGLDLAEAGPAMSEKVAELGEFHPYVQAILNGDDAQRDLAVQAVYDLVRSSTLTKRVVRDETRAAAIKREGELRREAAGVVTGAPHVAAAPEDPLMAAMEQEWRDRRQWGEE
jgi:hypothetical protein